MLRFAIVVLSVLSALTPHARAQPVTPQIATPAPLEVKVADNVFVVPDKNAKRVSAWMIVRAGCADEFNGDCRGIAHYLEHLLFINRDADGKSKIAMFPGGSGNGVTTPLVTFYQQSFPANAVQSAANLDTLMSYFSGMLVDVRATDEQAARELNVVVQENEVRTLRNPLAKFFFARSSLLMPGDSLGHQSGRTAEAIRALTVEDAKAFHKTWYHKSNTVIVVHGPISGDDLKPAYDKHFGPLPVGQVPRHPWWTAKPQTQETLRLDTSDGDVRETSVYLDRLVSFAEPSAAAERRLAVAARSLTNSYLASRIAGSPMDTLLERDNVVAQGGVSFSKLRDGLLRVSFSATPADGVTPEQVIAGMRAELARLAERGVSAEVVERLKTRQRVGRALLREEPERYANALVGWFNGHNSIASWHEIDAMAARVTAADVNAVLKSLNSPAREVVGVMTPKVRPATGEGAPANPAAPAAAPKE
jgi:zinc protease